LVDPTSSSYPQFVQRYVPLETSLPAGTGLAIIYLLSLFDGFPRSRSRSLETAECGGTTAAREKVPGRDASRSPNAVALGVSSSAG
jgi:hypothetical protein